MINIRSNTGDRYEIPIVFNEKEEVMGETGIYQVDLASESEEEVVLPRGKARSLESILIGF